MAAIEYPENMRVNFVRFVLPLVRVLEISPIEANNRGPGAMQDERLRAMCGAMIHPPPPSQLSYVDPFVTVRCVHEEEAPIGVDNVFPSSTDRHLDCCFVRACIFHQCAKFAPSLRSLIQSTIV